MLTDFEGCAGEIGLDNVLLFYASLDRPTAPYEGMLCHSEMARAHLFRFERDSTRFIVRRGILRMILGAFLGCEPNYLQFFYGPYGKPALTGQFSSESVSFNLSHSSGMALYALARSQEVGVDIEQIRGIGDIDLLVESCLSAGEKREFSALPESEKQAAFFRAWTCKEAFVKATGEGLSKPLDSFDVTLQRQAPAGLARIHGDPDELLQWSIRDLRLSPEFAAAVAIRNPACKVTIWRLPDLNEMACPLMRRK